MKIVVIINTLHRGGAERVVSRLTMEWAKSHEVVIALFSTKQVAYEHGGRIADLGLRLPANNPLQKICRIGIGAVRLVHLFRQERPDRIFSFMESANFPAVAAASTTGILDRLCVSVRNNPKFMRIPYRLLMPWLYRKPARVVAASKGIKDRLERMRIPGDRLSFIPNPVVTGCADRVRGLTFPHRFVLGAGRLVRQKGFDRLLRAFATLGRKDELHLVVLGEGSEREALIELAETLGIGSVVHFPGAVSDIETWYRSAVCFVLSSRFEGWPNVLMEAMASGCPVISYDCRFGPAEIVEDGKSGLLVAQDDIRALAAEISRVVINESLRRRLASEGIKRGRMFAVEEIAPRWLA